MAKTRILIIDMEGEQIGDLLRSTVDRVLGAGVDNQLATSAPGILEPPTPGPADLPTPPALPPAQQDDAVGKSEIRSSKSEMRSRKSAWKAHGVLPATEKPEAKSRQGRGRDWDKPIIVCDEKPGRRFTLAQAVEGGTRRHIAGTPEARRHEGTECVPEGRRQNAECGMEEEPIEYERWDGMS